MQRSSDSYVRKIFQRKLKDYEADVPGDSEDIIFSKLTNTRTPVFPKVVNSALLLALLLLVGNVADTPVATGTGTVITLATDDPKATIPLDPASDDATSKLPHTRANNPVAVGISPLSVSSAQKAEFAIPSGNKQLQAPALVDIHACSLPAISAKVGQDTVKSSEAQIIRMNNPDTVALPKEVDKENHVRTIRFLLGVTPLMTYNRIVPNRSDDIRLSDFKTPSRLSANRIGFRISGAAEFPLTPRRSLLAAVSYLQYHTYFEYHADETLHRLGEKNVVDESTRAMSVMLAVRNVIAGDQNRNYYVQGGTDVQFLVGRNASSSSGMAWMLFAGIGREWSWANGAVRVQPTAYYSLSRFKYGGLQSQPYGLGVEFAYVLKR